MIFSLDDDQARLVIESLAHYAERFRRIANDPAAGYPAEVQRNQLATATKAHDLAQAISDQFTKICQNRKKFSDRSEQQQHDVYEVNDWNPNDPRNW